MRARLRHACGRARVVVGVYCAGVWFIVACAMMLDSCGCAVWYAVGVSVWRVERVRVCARWERVCRACIAREGAICSRVCECVVLWRGSVWVGLYGCRVGLARREQPVRFGLHE